MAAQITSELLQQTLQHANIEPEAEPLKDSLHDKFIVLLGQYKLNFNDLAKRQQSKNKLEQLDSTSEVKKFCQKLYSVGSTLEVIKFGGYRQ